MSKMFVVKEEIGFVPDSSRSFLLRLLLLLRFFSSNVNGWLEFVQSMNVIKERRKEKRSIINKNIPQFFYSLYLFFILFFPLLSTFIKELMDGKRVESSRVELSPGRVVYVFLVTAQFPLIIWQNQIYLLKKNAKMQQCKYGRVGGVKKWRKKA